MPPIDGKVDVNDRSRYGNAKPTDIRGELAAEDVPAMVEEVKAVFASERTFSKSWRKAQLRQFKKMMVEGEKEICAAMKLDLGKAPFEGFATEIGLVISEVDTALAKLDEWMTPVKVGNSALNVPAWSTLERDPLGVILILGAWNYPCQLLLAPLVAAIAGGNCVILKPGSYAVNTSHALAKIVPQYLDNDCIKIVEGNRSMTSALLKQQYGKIIFTGSAYVGKVVARAAAETLTPTVLELGGKSPAIVDRSADIEHAAQRLVWGTFLNGGQTCVRPDFAMIHQDIADKFLAKMIECLKQFYGQDPKESEWFGRIINESAFERLCNLIHHEKSRVIVGGETRSEDRFVSPTIFDFGTDFEAFKKSELMHDEIFGPLLPVYRYSSQEQCVQFCRNLPTGNPLALYVYGTDQKFIDTFRTRTTSGSFTANDNLMCLINHELPFGGVGNSGMGNYHGKFGFDTCTHLKAVLQKSPMLDQSILFKPLLQMRFPPYSKFQQSIVRLFGNHSIEAIINLPVPAIQMALKILAAYVIMRLLGLNIVRNQ